MAEFEAACAARAIALLTPPPRSPKLHGTVERAALIRARLEPADWLGRQLLPAW